MRTKSNPARTHFMAQTASRDPSTLLAKRLVRYADLRPCTTAFIDTRTPGSAEKENFTIYWLRFRKPSQQIKVLQWPE